METSLRGILEKDLDSVTVEVLKTALRFKDFLPMKSIEDFLFGFLVGMVVARMATTIQIFYSRQINDAETSELMDLIQRRTLEIKGKIKLAMGQ
jgi:hypothetical protein